MGTGFSKKKKQAKVLQDQFSKMQEVMKETKVTGTAGGGLVQITLNGEHEMLKIELKKEGVDPEDVEGLEDLIKMAYNDALKQLQNSGPSLPGLASFGF